MAALDTSGVVEGAPYVEMPDGQKFLAVGWAMLSPFAQGYVEAIFAGLEHPGYIDVEPGNTDAGHIPVGFHRLAPEALAMILRDCARAEAEGWRVPRGQRPADLGGAFWRVRQNPTMPCGFPPLRVYLDDAGKVMLEVVS